MAPAAGLLAIVMVASGLIRRSALAQPAPEALAPAAPPPSASPTPALAPAYPDATDPAALGRWFGQTTHLPATSILAITENAIFAAFPRHDSGSFWTVDVRLESITTQSTARLGGRSIHLRLKVRCDNDTVRLDFLDVYPGADLTGAPAHRAPQNDWAQPKPNSYVADAVRLVCDKTFHKPFASVATATPQPKPGFKAKARAEASLEPVQARAPADLSTERPVLRPTQPLPGRYAVQIGAYSTPAASDGAWRALQAAMPDVTSGLSDATRPVQSAGRTLYRTMVRGFSSTAAAATFCQTLKASGRPCLTLGAVKP